jgi:hypothetical protein
MASRVTVAPRERLASAAALERLGGELDIVRVFAPDEPRLEAATRSEAGPGTRLEIGAEKRTALLRGAPQFERSSVDEPRSKLEELRAYRLPSPYVPGRAPDESNADRGAAALGRAGCERTEGLPR